MKILITICGRKGSKGLPNKNIREFNGYPLIEFTIAAAKMFKDYSNFHVDISVNSDSEELLEIAGKFSFITTVFRPQHLGQDSTPKLHVIKQTMDFMEDLNQIEYDFVIDLDITSPMRNVRDINNTLGNLLDNENLDVVFSVVESRRNPYFNMVEEVGGRVMKVKDSDFVARQQAPRVYDMNASIYAFRRSSLRQKFKKSPFDGECGLYIMRDNGVLDIDSEEDFNLMSIISEYLFKNEYKELYNYVCECGESYKNGL